MNTVIAVFTSLGVDSTFWVQFAISVAFLFLAKIVFVNDLSRVLAERVQGTVGADGDAEKIHQETENSKKRYEKLLGEKVVEIQNEYSNQRKKIKDELDKDFKEQESKVINNFKKEIEIKKNEFIQLQSKVETETESLASELLNKIKQ